MKSLLAPFSGLGNTDFEIAIISNSMTRISYHDIGY